MSHLKYIIEMACNYKIFNILRSFNLDDKQLKFKKQNVINTCNAATVFYPTKVYTFMQVHLHL